MNRLIGEPEPDEAQILRDAQRARGRAILDALAAMGASVTKAIRAWHVHHREKARLRALDDRILADVGLTRTGLVHGGSPAAPANRSNPDVDIQDRAA